ncbi:MAG: DUF3135 domain-containing protein [Rhodocyclaceae bacterium]|nr:DUF3135 domain-containing protein [Rhodocyclaceae bacterium]
MDVLKKIGFDFEEMTRLAKTDPDEFVRRREELIQQFIARTSRPTDLANMQMDLDATRYCASPGMQAGGKITEMLLKSTACMTKHVARLSDLLETTSPKA